MSMTQWLESFDETGKSCNINLFLKIILYCFWDYANEETEDFTTDLKILLNNHYFYFANPLTRGEILADESQLNFATDFSVAKIPFTKIYI